MRGFLPDQDPIVNLEDKEFKGLNQAMEDLPYLFGTGKIRNVTYTYLKNFTEIDTDWLDERQAKALQRDLAFLAAAFLHTKKRKPIKNLPASIAVPLCKLAKKTKATPTLIYDLYGLNNFWRPDPTQPISLENVRTIRNFVNNIDEPWFIMVHIVIEAQAQGLIEGIDGSFKAIKNSDWHCLRTSIEKIGEALNAIIDTLLKMPLACSTFIYHHNVRPQIMPFKNVIYNGVQEYGEEPQSFIAGETGAQSSIVPLLDAFFKIEHSSTEGFDYVKEMRRYMPKKHVQLIEQVEKQASIRPVVISMNDRFVTEAFNSAVDAFYRFRKLHYQYATEYIFEKLTEQTGTGGTPASVWLNQLAEETKQALI